jgi:hypothetical protein
MDGIGGSIVSFFEPHSRRIVVALLGALVIVASAGPMVAAAQTPKLIEIRAAHHPGFDRIVFEFEGPLPTYTRANWASALKLDPSDKPAHVQGEAFLRVRLFPAVAHEPEPPQDPTISPSRRAYALPNIAHVVLLGDSEGEVSVGIGLMKKTHILRAARLTKPSRFVIDVATGFKKGQVKVYFVDAQAVIDGQPPYVVPVKRKVPRGRRAEASLQRLYAGPTEGELDAGLRFVASGTRGFRDLWVNGRAVARVTLRGPCDSGGSAEVTVASEVMATLRSRPAIDWVKIYDRRGETGQPWGRSDSIPACLEP